MRAGGRGSVHECHGPATDQDHSDPARASSWNQTGPQGGPAFSLEDERPEPVHVLRRERVQQKPDGRSSLARHLTGPEKKPKRVLQAPTLVHKHSKAALSEALIPGASSVAKASSGNPVPRQPYR